MKTQTALGQVSRNKLEKLAINMRRKARNQAMDRERMQQRLYTAVVGAGAALGVGVLMGMRQEQGQSTEVSGVDLELVIGGTATLAGIVLQGRSGTMRKAGEFLESGGMGVIAYYAGSRGEQWGAEMARAA